MLTEFTLKNIDYTDEINKLISEGMKEHTLSTMGFENKSEYMVFASYKDEEFVGGIVYRIYWGTLSIKYLYVKKEYRKLKVGTNLLKNLFSLAKKKFTCRYCYLSTLSFQALEFYKKLGFEIEFVRDKFKEDIKEYYLVGKL